MATKKSLPSTFKRLVAVGSEKGGVGKSVFSRSYVDHLRSMDHPITVAAFDADGGVGSLVRTLGSRDDAGRLLPEQNPVDGVGYYNVRSDERAAFLDKIEDAHFLMVHDLAGGSLTDLTRIVDGGEGLDGLLAAFEENGYRLTIAHLLSADIGSAQSVARWIDLTGDRVDHVAVRNMAFTAHPYWDGFKAGDGSMKGGKTREKLLELGGVEISMPKMPDGTFAKLDAENIAFSKANDAGILTISERAHVSKYRKDFAAALAPAAAFLGLE